MELIILGAAVAILTALATTAIMAWYAERLRAAARGGAEALQVVARRDADAAVRAGLRQRLSVAEEAAQSERAARAAHAATQRSQEEALAGLRARLDAETYDSRSARAATEALQERLAEITVELDAVRKERDRAGAAQLSLLAERALTSPRAIVHELVGHHHSRAALRAQLRARETLERLAHDEAAAARRLLTITTARYDGVGHLERVQNTFALAEHPALRALLDPESPARAAFAQLVGCELEANTVAGALVIRGEDPLARELARRVMSHVETVDSDAITRLAQGLRRELDAEVDAAGREAFVNLELAPAHPEIIALVGRLKFRLSYSQNQWKHALEVACLAGMLAAELGVDPVAARRGGLLHDIGKAMTHDHDGSHAVLGAAVARRCGEAELVANAIGAHHADEPAHSAVAEIVTAADAISGARPGARRESVTAYFERLRQIQAIAHRSPLVSRVDVMHAGREVRVHVHDDERGDRGTQSEGRPYIADGELYPLAQEIARRIEEEVVFAGQVRVTVIRESRSIAIAR